MHQNGRSKLHRILSFCLLHLSGNHVILAPGNQSESPGEEHE
ncbi:hypothetical protein EVA_06315 [gut metagenome]|uniref:Uncharacterized protein n=1 Tax=gut metagenome TaxID=749906 RepID=J9GE28_9ZZZZ